MNIVEQLTAVVGDGSVVDARALRERATSYWDSSPTEAQCLLRPESTEQLSALMRICHDNNQSVVVQGGLTGLVEGAVSTASDVIISLERMSRIESIDPWDGIAVVQAGAVMQSVQEQVAAKGFLFPLDFAARGTATRRGRDRPAGGAGQDSSRRGRPRPRRSRSTPGRRS